MTHKALVPGRAAVITGGASGIGLATAQKLARLGMNICIADIDADALRSAARSIADAAGNGVEVVAVPCDVSRMEDVERLKDKAYSAFGEVGFLMNNAGTEGGGKLFGGTARWRQIIDVNLWGVINGIQIFLPTMLAQGNDCAVVNTGSKQGITCPPGDTAYNISKAGIKVVTEALAHELRNIASCRISAHLLIPGFTFTGFTRIHTQTKPDAAWTPEQVVDFMFAAMDEGDFYILCPDNSVTREVDEARMRWAMDDIIANRPPLSRWHKDHANAFSDFLEAALAKEKSGGR